MLWNHKFKFRKNNYTAGHIIVVLLAFSTPLLIGTPILYWQSGKALYRKAQTASRATVNHVDSILDNAKEATEESSLLLNKPCSEIVEALRIKATTTSFIRSLIISDQGIVYCSTVYGEAKRPLNVHYFHRDRLALLSGNIVTPDRAILVYQLKKNDTSVIATIDGLHVIQLLNSNEMTPETTLIVGSYWMGRDGQVHNTVVREAGKESAYASSIKYPFSVQSGYGKGALLEYILTRHLPLLALLVALGGLSAFAVNRLAMSARNMTAEIKRAIRNNEFMPYYQPVVRSDTQEWIGAEVLVRWAHPIEGLIPPDNFIPFMERSGLIIPMTTGLMERVAKELAAIQKSLPDDFHIGINISSAQLAEEDLVSQCRQFLEQFPAGKVQLVLELTEREAIEPTEELQERVGHLRQAGVQIALDDFGVGHSNLNYLQEFHADLLKIDRSFVAGIINSDLSQHVLQSIIDLAIRLNLKIVAEGIETQEQADYLLEKGIHLLQGYYFSAPVPVETFADLLQKHKTAKS